MLTESYIYQLNDFFYKKKIILLYPEIQQNSKFDKNEIQKQTSEIIEIVRKYSLTKLTQKERQIFDKLKDNVTRLERAETQLFSRQMWEPEKLISFCDVSVNQLHLLSSIQVREGNLLKENSRKVLSSSHLAAQLEWAVFIIVLLLFVSILPKRKIFEEIFPKHQLN